jgi:DNA-directed RNA polymerase subunit RPC12/RpoP
MAIYKCKDCAGEEFLPRRFRLHFGEAARCPKCGTYRVVRLKGRDRIDPMFHGPFNLMERLAGGRLYHCCFCRIQFYDRRRLSQEVDGGAAQPVTAAAHGVRPDA